MDIQLARLRKRLEERRIALEITDKPAPHRAGRLRSELWRAAAEASDPEGARDAAGPQDPGRRGPRRRHVRVGFDADRGELTFEAKEAAVTA